MSESDRTDDGSAHHQGVNGAEIVSSGTRNDATTAPAGGSPADELAPIDQPGLVARALPWLALVIAIVLIGRHVMPGSVGTPPADLPPADTAAGYPEWQGAVRAAMDVRGRRGPQVVAESWITERPADLGERVLVIDFWATWCPPCIRALPHMRDLATHFGDRVHVVGLSSEPREAFLNGLEQRGLAAEELGYALAVDAHGRTGRTIALRGIPHCVVMSRDGVVRWQGPPDRLTIEVLDAIVEADAAAG